MSNQPTLSVLMPNYNHAQFLPQSLGAILRQSYRPMEIIVIDDASTDNSVEVIESFKAKEPRLRLMHNERNLGAEKTVNRLLEKASGEYIYLGSADDMILPGFFEKSMDLLSKYPQAGLCSTVGRLIDENGNDRGIRAIPVVSALPRFFSPQEVLKKLRWHGRWITTPTVIQRRDALMRVGGYCLELGSFADTFAALIIALKYGACYIPEPLTCWRVVGKGNAFSSATNWEGLLKKGMLACRLMRTTYRDICPSDFVAAFERQWMYAVSASIGRQVRVKQERLLVQALKAVYNKQGFLDRVFGLVMSLSVRVQAMVWQFYSTIRFAPWRWWIMGRLSIIVNLRKFVLIDKIETRLK